MIASLISLWIADADAADRTVCAAGCDFTAIQPALDAADPGDRVLVGPGAYTADLAVQKSVHLVGRDGSGATTLASHANGAPFVVDIGAGLDVEVRGFALALNHAGGVRASGGTLALRDLSATGTVAGNVIAATGTTLDADDLVFTTITDTSSPILLTGGTATLSHLAFTDVHGPTSGIAVSGGALTVADVRIAGGGAACLAQSAGASTVIVRRAVVSGCAAAAVDVQGGSIDLQDATFRGNVGPTLRVGDGATDVTVERSAFDSNVAPNTDSGGALAIGAAATTDLRDVLFRGNRAGGAGGALFVGSTGLVIERTRFSANAATDGGAIAATSATIALSDSAFDGDTSTNSGGAAQIALPAGGSLDARRSVWCENASSASILAASGGSSTSARVTDLVFDANSATGGAALAVDVGVSFVAESLFIDDVGLDATHGTLASYDPTPCAFENNGIIDGTGGAAFTITSGGTFRSDTNVWAAPSGTDVYAPSTYVDGASALFDANLALPARPGACETRAYRPGSASDLFGAGGADSDVDADAGPFAPIVDPTNALEDLDNDGFIGVYDCDDTDPLVHPGATESCNGVDDDCEHAIDDLDTDAPVVGGVPLYADRDGDGHGSSTAIGTWCADAPLWPRTSLVGDDCNDGNAAVHPGATEAPYNGVNDDCDSATRDDDLDHDGSNHINDCNDNDPTIHRFAEDIPYDGIDQDCDGHDLCDADGDGHGLPDCSGDPSLPADDCDDTDPAVYPGAEDVPNDGIDQDCHGGDLKSRFGGGSGFPCGCGHAGPVGGAPGLAAIAAVLAVRSRRRRPR